MSTSCQVLYPFDAYRMTAGEDYWNRCALQITASYVHYSTPGNRWYML